MWVNLDGNGYILGHNYKETSEYNIKCPFSVIFDLEEFAYIYKKVGENWIELQGDEKKNQPQVIINKTILLREKRNFLLKDSDFSVLEDSPVDKQAWKVYRQALRDLPNIADIHNPIYPIKPGSTK